MACIPQQAGTGSLRPCGHQREDSAMADDGSRVPDSTSRAIASTLFQEAGKAFQRGEYAAAAERYDAAFALYATLPDTQHDQARCLFGAGFALMAVGEYAAAVERFDAARALYATLPGTEGDQADCLFNAGAALGSLGEYATATNRFDAAFALYATLPDTQHDQADCQLNAGFALVALGEYATAIGRYDTARALYATLPDTQQEQADCLDAIATAHSAAGRSTEASDTRAQASSLRRTSERDEITRAKNMLMAMDGAEYPASTDDLRWALDVFRKKRGTKAQQTLCLMYLAATAYANNSPEEALSWVDQLRTTVIESGNEELVTKSIYLHASMLSTEARFRENEQEAAELLEESLPMAMEAALRMDQARFRLAKPSQRETWIRNRAEDVMNLAIELAAELNRAELVSDLIATWRTVGVLDLQISTSSPGPGDLDARTLLTSHLPLLPDAAPTLLADAGLPVPGNAPQADAPDDSSALAAAPPVGSQTALSGTDLPRRPGPHLVMPHHRTALDTYSTVPLTTLSPDPEPVRATYR